MMELPEETTVELAQRVIKAADNMSTPGTARWHSNALAAPRLARSYLELRDELERTRLVLSQIMTSTLEAQQLVERGLREGEAMPVKVVQFP